MSNFVQKVKEMHNNDMKAFNGVVQQPSSRADGMLKHLQHILCNQLNPILKCIQPGLDILSLRILTH